MSSKKRIAVINVKGIAFFINFFKPFWKLSSKWRQRPIACLMEWRKQKYKVKSTNESFYFYKTKEDFYNSDDEISESHILIKGSRGMKMEEIIKNKLKWKNT